MNGSFETNTISTGYTTLFGTNLSGWSAGEYGIELRNGVSGVAQSGTNFVELDTMQNSSMSQALSISAPGSYKLSFWYSARPDNGTRNGDTDKLSWSFGGEHGSVLESYKNGDSSAWKQFSTVVTFEKDDLSKAKSKLFALTFSADGKSDSYGGSLDNVSVFRMAAPVPEPESYAMMLAGLGLMMTIARRRSQRKA